MTRTGTRQWLLAGGSTSTHLPAVRMQEGWHQMSCRPPAKTAAPAQATQTLAKVVNLISEGEEEEERRKRRRMKEEERKGRKKRGGEEGGRRKNKKRKGVGWGEGGRGNGEKKRGRRRKEEKERKGMEE